jgi:hypothetical protein
VCDLQKLLAMLVAPLSELSSVSQSDVRQRQLDCVLSVLHGSGDILNGSWTAILNILAAATADLGYTHSLALPSNIIILFVEMMLFEKSIC